ncbi:hypothetical protein [Ralstonia pseudosolanacearum]|uniref:hypothetical protein n=1 Tax=Ralstonia pseudosolanacearum TaxID=1310165 RepID=UPI003CE87FC2
MELETLTDLLDELGLKPQDVVLTTPARLFPDVSKFKVNLGIDSDSFVVGDLMKLPAVSSACSAFEFANDILLDDQARTSVVWRVRLKSGVTLILTLEVEDKPDGSDGKWASGQVSVVAEEVFVGFVEELAVEDLRSLMTDRAKLLINKLQSNVTQLLEGANPKRVKHIASELRTLFFASDPNRASVSEPDIM